MKTICPKCDGVMERGYTTSINLLVRVNSGDQKSHLLFIVPGTTTSLNPIKAFEQGFSDEMSNREYRIVGVRCSQCGLIEFYGEDDSKAQT